MHEPALDPVDEPSEPGRLRALWRSTDPWRGTAALLAGFVWDSLTLRRIDRVPENLYLLGSLTALGLLLVLYHRVARDPERWPRIAPRAAWLDYAVRFLFGGLYSAYFVFYFKSASWGRSLVFLAVLAGLLVANEYLVDRLRAERLRIALYALCSFSFLLFFVPVLTGVLLPRPFAAILAFGAAMVVAWGMLRPVASAALRPYAASVAGVLLGLLALDGLGLVPPVPLALVDGGIFHHVERTASGYEARYEAGPWYAPWRRDDREFRKRPDDRAWCFSAIFAPTGMELAVVHVWEWYDPEQGAWIETNRIPFEVRGGRDGGYRGYTYKRHLAPGDWRVRVLTARDRELGRYGFEVEPVDADEPPVWATRTFE